YQERVRASFLKQAIMSTLGVEIVRLGPGWIDLGFARDQRFTQQHGYVHAGVVATVLDSACGYAAFSLMQADAAVLTVEFKINLLRPASHDRYLVSGVVLKPGRTLTICQATAVPSEGGEPVALMTGTLMSLVGDGDRELTVGGKGP
ncbi:MAG TPA: PaaI family thioesterase, partial [Acidimicrobiia bacterium]|nr:PaaI family thioesterase [Acidimicrobiia bacterium]